MTTLRGWVPCLGWLAVAAGATFIATLRMEPTAEALALAIVACGFVFLVHLPGFRSRPLVRAAGVPLVTGVLAGAAAFGAYQLEWQDVRAYWRDDPAWWLLAAVVLGPLLVRLLVPPQAGRRVLRLMDIEWRKIANGRLRRDAALLVLAVVVTLLLAYRSSWSDFSVWTWVTAAVPGLLALAAIVLDVVSLWRTDRRTLMVRLAALLAIGAAIAGWTLVDHPAKDRVKDVGVPVLLGLALVIVLFELRRGWLPRIGLLLAVAVTLAFGLTYEPTETESGWAIAASMLKSGTWMAEILLLVLGAVAIAGEVGQGTMKMILPHAYKRSDWIISKGLLLSLIAVGFMLLIGLTSVGYAHFTHGLGDVIKKGEPAFGVPDQLFQTADTMRSHIIDTVLAGTASLIVIAWISLLFSALFSSVVPALSTAFLVFVALRFGDLLLGYSRDLQEKLFTSYPEWMREATRNLGRGLNDRWEPALLSECLWLCGLTVLLAALASITIFDRRELG